jgi:anti-sigma regulatory factor (Ser/Thr protein kinase)
LSCKNSGTIQAQQGNQMETMAPIRPTVHPLRRISLRLGPAAAAEARRQVEAAVYAYRTPVDVSVAVLLASELVTNAIRHQAGETAELVIDCARGQLRVDVHDTSGSLPVLMDAPADAESGRGLMLVATLSADWGYYRTPAGKAVYFTLAGQVHPDEGRDRSPRGSAVVSGKS